MSLNSEFGRQPFEVVRIYLDQCGQPGFGLGTCTATGEPCYFTRATCLDVGNFINSAGTKILTFCSQTARIPDGLGLGVAIPCIIKVQPSPPVLDVNGGMGIRASTSVVLADFPHSDLGTDPYVFFRSYDPILQGTYFGKLKARNPFYTGRRMEVLTGYLTADGNFEESNFKSRNYFIDSWTGPVGGQVSITAKDVLRLAGDDKAQAPFISLGRLSADINNTVLSATLLPAGIGATYPADGLVKIGKELIPYTRVGDTLTFTSRGGYGTDPDDHGADDAVQLCLVFSASKPQDILYWLLVMHAKIPPVYLDKVQWDQEQTDYMPRLYSTVIASPTGVSKLINEMCEQMGFYLWWHEVEQKVKLRAIRPAADSELKILTEEYNIDDSSVAVRDLVDERFNEVWVFYGLIDYTEKLNEPSNYRGQYAKPALPEQDAAMDGDVKIKKIFSRWITVQNAVAAYDLGDKTIERSKSTPIELNFAIDAKDGDIDLADFVAVQTRAVQTCTGAPAVIPVQVLKRSEPVVGSKIKITARQTYITGQPGGDPTPSNVRKIIIAADDFGVNLRSLHDSIYAQPVGGEIIQVIVRGGVGVGGKGKNLLRGVMPTYYSLGYVPRGDVAVKQLRNPLAYESNQLLNFHGFPHPPRTNQEHASIDLPNVYRWAANSFRTGIWPAGVSLKMTIEPNAFIMGEGGNGSDFFTPDSAMSFLPAVPLSAGGNALIADYPITIDNQGTIAAGGGGGWGVVVPLFSPALIVIHGGGGQGWGVDDDDELYVNKFGGRVGSNFWLSDFTQYQSILSNVKATAGSKTTAGVGATLTATGFISMIGKNGGLCGANPTDYNTLTQAHGQPGFAVINNHLITWENVGTIIGEVV